MNAKLRFVTDGRWRAISKTMRWGVPMILVYLLTAPALSHKVAAQAQRESAAREAAAREAANRFDAVLARLKTYAEKGQPALAEALKKFGFDSDTMLAEFRAISEEPDAAKRAQRGAEFQTKYESQFIKLAQSAGIDLAAQRRQMITLLDLSNLRVKEGKTLVIEAEDDRQSKLPPAPPPPAPSPSCSPAPRRRTW